MTVVYPKFSKKEMKIEPYSLERYQLYYHDDIVQTAMRIRSSIPYDDDPRTQIKEEVSSPQLIFKKTLLHNFQSRSVSEESLTSEKTPTKITADVRRSKFVRAHSLQDNVNKQQQQQEMAQLQNHIFHNYESPRREKISKYKKERQNKSSQMLSRI